MGKRSAQQLARAGLPYPKNPIPHSPFNSPSISNKCFVRISDESTSTVFVPSQVSSVLFLPFLEPLDMTPIPRIFLSP